MRFHAQSGGNWGAAQALAILLNAAQAAQDAQEEAPHAPDE